MRSTTKKMPTIELISLNAGTIPQLPSYSSFAYIVEPDLVSHRGLFQHIFDRCKGYIVHLGNKEFENNKDGFWYAGRIMNWEEDAVVFLKETLSDLMDLIQRMIDSSPNNEILFSTDYQFGPQKPVDFGAVFIDEFYELHRLKKLRWNSIYKIQAEHSAVWHREDHAVPKQ